MTNDFLDELAELALGSRLKRLSERLITDAAQVYKYCGHDVQPKWFTLLALLDKKQQVSIVDAAQLLGLTQPAISQFSKELIAKGLVISTLSDTDSRKKFLSLSEQGKVAVLAMQPMWQAVDSAAKQLCNEAGVGFFESVKNFEKALSQQSLLQRSISLLEQASAKTDVEFIDFTPELAIDFKSINSEWINEMFELEASDLEALNYPQKNIIDKGGKIYFAKHRELGIVGTCALLKKEDNSFELTKMGVLKKARGLKIGETLLEYVIDRANEIGLSKLFLLTNHTCEAAIHLYEKHGFRHDVNIMEMYASKYKRCDVAMRYFK
ncbi:MAG: GNAT family N-acetyltransferase [Colwellia sp.]|nr:GNAT family N-acetyltransferase [Colwellia sp.]